MKTQTLLAPFRRAIEDYKMIEEGDKIAVGVSGGKDSLTLLALLKALQRFYPKKFDIVAITIDLGFCKDHDPFEPVQKWCDEMGVPYYVERTDIGEILFSEEQIAAQEQLVNGYRVVSNCGCDAGQTVPHLHFHIVPKYEGGFEFGGNFTITNPNPVHLTEAEYEEMMAALKEKHGE